MNGRNRHIQYRRSVYRKRKIRTIIITVSIVVLLLALLFVFIGNLLHNQSEDRRSDVGTDSTSAETSPPSHVLVDSISAYPVLLETADSSTFSSRLQALANSGGQAASILLNTADGKLLYHSPIAISMNLQAAGEHSVALDSTLSLAQGTGIYISGLYHLSSLSCEDDLLRSVKLAQDCAIIAEAVRAGANDILLIAPHMTEEKLSEVAHLLDKIRSLCPNAVLGITLSDHVILSENAAALIDSLYSAADFLALDATVYADKDAATYIEEKITDGENSIPYYLRRYRMRVLIPQMTDDTAQSALIEIVEKNGIENWQILPYVALP